MQILYIGIIFFVIALFGMLGMLAYKLLKTGDLKADIYEERDDGSRILTMENKDIRIIKGKDGKLDKFKIVGTAIPPFMPITRDFWIPRKGKKIDKLTLLRDKDGFFHPFKMDMDEKQRQLVLKPHYRDQMDWMAKEYDERAKLKEKTLGFEKYYPTITLVICFMMFFVTVFFGWKYTSETINTANAKGETILNQLATINPQVIIEAASIVARERQITATQNWTQTTIVTNTGQAS